MLKVKIYLFSLWLSISLSVLACVADPWPEPDSMEEGSKKSDGEQPSDIPPVAEYNEDPDAEGTEQKDVVAMPTDDDINGLGTDTDSDVATDVDTEIGSSIETDSDVMNQTGDTDEIKTEDTEMDSVADASDTDSRPAEGVDAGDVELDGGTVDVDRILFSSPSGEGDVTVVGLPGAMPSGSVVSLISPVFDEEIKVGADGGFAARVEDVKLGDTYELMVEFEHGVESIPLKLGYGVNEGTQIDVLGNSSVISPFSDTMITIEGNGGYLTPDSFVVAANVTLGTASMGPTLCAGESCAFSLVIPAVLGDVIDLFVVKKDVMGGSDVQLGSSVQSVVVDF